MDIPNHVAIILDGNGRWAKAKGMPRNYGHTAGSKNVEVICEEAYKMGIQYLTIYAFSTENWSRPDDEVAAHKTRSPIISAAARTTTRTIPLINLALNMPISLHQNAGLFYYTHQLPSAILLL